MAFSTRFAPSPTGRLHIGHARSALIGWARARAAGGAFHLRIEDIDAARCRPEFDAAILDDLAWLGIDWDGPVWRQSMRGAVYAAALDRLRNLGVVYACTCSRADIAAASVAPHGAAGPVYPGTCRDRGAAASLAAGQPYAWRLDIARADALTGPLTWHDAAAGEIAARPRDGGDIVIGRKDVGTSYHLAVVVDDAAQGITEVIRGSDLFLATHVQRLLQALLGLPAPAYRHHPLVLGADGKRLAKRDGATSLGALRAAGTDAAALRARLLETVEDCAFVAVLE